MTKTTRFSSATYETSADRKRRLGDRLFGNSRFYFFSRYFGMVLAASKLAREGIYDDTAWEKSSSDIFQLIEDCGGRFSISGFDHLRQLKGPAVIVSNHMSSLETQILPCLINPIRPVTFVVKEKLVRMKIFGPIMRSRDPVTVTRANPRQDLVTVLEEGVKRLAAGRSLVIFPESTRHLEFDPANFNSLGVKLARRAGVPIVPVALKTDFWGNGKWVRDFGAINREKRIHFVFGPPLEINGNEKEVHAECTRFISNHWGRFLNS